MKVKINDCNKWKKDISLVASRIDKKPTNLIEGTLHLIFNDEENKLVIKASKSESFYISRNIQDYIEIIEGGEIYVNASSITSLNDNLIKDSSLTIESDGSQLVYEIPKYGSISEPLFTSADPFPVVEEDISKPSILIKLEDKQDKLIDIISKVSNISISPIEINVTTSNVSIYAQTEYSLIKYVLNLDNEEDYRIVIPNSFVKNLSLIKGEENRLYGLQSPIALKAVSNKGTLHVLGTDVEIGEYSVLDESMKERYKARGLVDATEFLQALSIQSYRSTEVTDSISLELKKDNLKIKGTNTKSASVISSSSNDSFREVKIPINAVASINNLLSNYGLLLIDFYENDMDEGSVSSLLIHPGEACDVDCYILLYEQVILS
ncbi:hypothetical protein H6G33_10515 [Calothrix sp. FACHB-1219]|uniref:hypothetical protein n=1 Tax=unclassified Calothrix TaxID=2619626 RepID=UPI00168607E1|nr:MULTISPECIES: hypothetical protein [unclassified Calothrix]MBD2201780.1 hypothetical protein [Calothrix sp. FACHB-168]MBD2217466.1 hypothetical protein [Calothrix sp. FACHB-1219]